MRYTIIILLLLTLTAITGAAEIESVNIGWENIASSQAPVRGGSPLNYYRIGYWCPVRIAVKSDSDYTGDLSVRVDNVTYLVPISIPAHATKEIQLNVIINTAYPEIDIRLSGEATGFVFRNTLQAVPPETLLIGIESSLLSRLNADLPEQSPTSQKIHYFQFQIPQLPFNAGAYETVNHLVISTNDLTNHLTEMNKYLESGGHIVGVSEPLSANDIFPEAKPKSYSPQPCVMPAIYQQFDGTPWHNRPRMATLNFLFAYGLMIIIMTLLFIRLKLKHYSPRVFAIGLVLWAGIVVGLLYSSYLPAEGVGSFNLVAQDTVPRAGRLTSGTDEFVMVYNQFTPTGVCAKLTSPDYKPIYKEQADKPPLTIRFNPDGSVLISMPLDARIVFKTGN